MDRQQLLHAEVERWRARAAGVELDEAAASSVEFGDVLRGSLGCARCVQRRRLRSPSCSGACGARLHIIARGLCEGCGLRAVRRAAALQSRSALGGARSPILRWLSLGSPGPASPVDAVTAAMWTALVYGMQHREGDQAQALESALTLLNSADADSIGLGPAWADYWRARGKLFTNQGLTSERWSAP